MSDYFVPDGAGQSSSNSRPITPQTSFPQIRDATSEAMPETPGGGPILRFPSYPSSPGRQARPTPPMRIRRLPSLPNTTRPSSSSGMVSDRDDGQDEPEGRRRSFSDPSRGLSAPHSGRPQLSTQPSNISALPTVQEERNSMHLSRTLGDVRPSTPPALPGLPAGHSATIPSATPPPPPAARGRLRTLSNAARSFMGRERGNSVVSRGSSGPDINLSDPGRGTDYEAEVVDMLDVVDPEVSTLTTLNNVQNSLFVPYLGRSFNRQPTYELTPSTLDRNALDLIESRRQDAKSNLPETIEEERPHEGSEAASEKAEDGDLPPEALNRMSTIKSTLSGMSEGHHFAVLPHGVRLEGWTQQEKEELDDHVRHLLHSRRAGFRRSMRAFGKYVQKPMGFLVTAYAVIITFWGAAWVIFLIGWIHVGDKKDYWVDACDQVLTALLVVIGIGLLPWRVVDTYHMIYIAHYHYKIWRLRRERGLPALADENDLPDTDPSNKPTQYDIEAGRSTPSRPLATRHESVVLEPREMRILRYHQQKFANRHTFYKPHETSTHRAFSVRLLITIVVLLDFHSLFQIALATTTWAIDYHVRGRVTTTVILAFSLSCNISGGIIISQGDKRARKKEVFEQAFRQARTEEAMAEIQKKTGRPRLELRPSLQNLENAKDREHRRQEVEQARLEEEANVTKKAAAI